MIVWCRNIPSGTANMLVQQMIPYDAWTNLFIVPPLLPKLTYMLRVLSMEDKEICFKNITSSQCLKITKSSNTSYVFGEQPVVLSSTRPVSVVQYAMGLDKGFSSGPFMIVIPGIKNYLNTYRFIIPEIKPATEHFVVAIVPSSKANGILIDGVVHKFDNTYKVTTALGSYTVLMKTIGVGYHEMKHADTKVRFGALAYGMGKNFGGHSYGLPLGFAYTRTGEYSECIFLVDYLYFSEQ